MRIKSCIMLVFFAAGATPSVVTAQPKPDKVMRTAVIETRLIRDSSGCPTALDLWLVATTDTIQGFEAVLQWDRPEHPQFLRGVADTGKKPSPADSLTALLKPSDPRTQIPIDRRETLISGWEYVEARSTDGQLVKILAVAKLLGHNDPMPILPGASGALLRIQLLAPSTREAPPDSTSATLSFDPAGTRLSTARGVLFGPLTLRSTTVDLRACTKREMAK